MIGALPSISLWDRTSQVARFVPAVLVVGLAAGLAATGNKIMILPIGAVFGVCGVLILLSKPQSIFWGMLGTVMFNDHLALPLGGMNVRPYVGLACLGIGALAVLVPTGGYDALLSRAQRLAWMFIPLAALGLSKVASWYLVQEQPMGMPRSFPMKHMVFASLLYASAFVTALYIPGRRGLERGVCLWIWLSSIACVIGLIQIVASNALGMHWVHQRSVIFYGRPFSWFREPDVFGSVAGATTLLIVPFVLLKSQIMERRWLWAHLGINGLLLLLLFVRAAWLGSIVAGGLVAFGLLRLRKLDVLGPWIKAGVAGLLLLCLLMPILAPSFAHDISERVGSLAKPSEEGASKYRMQDLGAMMDEIKPKGPPDKAAIKLLFGRGDMSWSYWAPYLIGDLYDTNALRLLRNFGYVKPHPGFCMAVTYTFDNGVVGIALITLFFAILIGRVLVLVHLKCPHEDAALLLGPTAGVVVLLVCFQFSYDPITPFFWILIGLAVATVDAIAHPKENEQ